MISRYLLILIGILLLGIILRFVNIPDRYIIDGDGVRDAIVAYEGAKTLSFPLTGPFSSTGPYTFGPLYYLSLILFSFFFPVAYSPWFLMGILSLITIILMADIGRLLYSKTLGIILAFLIAIAPTQINAAMSLSNINPVLFFTTLSIWITLKIIKKESSHCLWYLFLGLVLGMGINAHYQMAGLLMLPFFLWIFMGWKKYYIPLLIVFGIFLTFIPFLIFNMQTDWHTLRGLQDLYIAKDRIYVPNSWTIYLFTFWPSHLQFLFFLPVFIMIALVATFLVVFFTDLAKKKYFPGLLILALVFFLNFLWLRYYWGERNDVYLSYLNPILFIFLGYTLVSLLQMKYGKVLFIIFFLTLSWNMLSTDYTRIKEITTSETLAWKKEAQMLLAKYPNNNITLYSCDLFYTAHKRYLVYLLSFHYQPQAQEKKIAMKGSGCSYPNATKDIYPPLFPELKDTNFNFIDLSPATPDAIKNASWRSITTEDIFTSTVNWWK